MNIIYLHQYFSTPDGSAMIRSYAMARKLIERGHNVTMFCGSYDAGHTGLEGAFYRGKREGMVDGIHVIEFNLPYSNSDSFFKRIKSFIHFTVRSVHLSLTYQYDLLFATTTPLTVGIPGIFARWLKHKPFVFEVRDLWPDLIQGLGMVKSQEMGVIKHTVIMKLITFLAWASYHSAHRLIGLSPGIVNGIVRLGVRPQDITMIPNGCDLQIFADKSQPWRPIGIRRSDFIAVFAGTHGIANGLDAVLDVAAILKKRGRDDIKIVLIGRGKQKPALEARAFEEGLENIIFHPPVSKQILAGLMADADIGLQILVNIPEFYYGTSPNKFFDYIAAGLPVLNNYPGWLADMVKKYNCGFVVPPNNEEAFADTLEEAASSREILKEMSKNARRLAETEFSREKLSDHFVNWLERAVKA